MLSSNVFYDAKLRSGVRRVSMMACGALAVLSLAIGGCPGTTPDPACTTAADCDDGLACTDDTCDLSSGTGVCSNADNCTGLDTCNTTNGACEAPTCTDDTDCDDLDACNGAETCDTTTSLCVPGTDVVCNNADLCNPETCDSATGDCNADAVVCTVTGESCNPNTGTCSAPCTTDTECDDNLFCTGTETCDTLTNFCLPGTDPCATGTTCNETNDTCDAGSGQTFNLTTDDEAITGTTGDDTFVAGIGTLNPADVVLGNGGNDTMDAVVAGTTLSAGPNFVTIIDIDNLNLTPLNATTINASNTAAIGSWNVVMPGSTGALTLTSLEAAPNIDLASGYNRVLTASLVTTGATTEINVTLNGTATGAGITTPDDAALGTLNVDVTADSWLSASLPNTTFFGAAAAIPSAVFTGSGNITLDGGNATDLAADSIDMSGFDGNVTVGPVANAAATLNFSVGGLDFPNVNRYIINDTNTTNAHSVQLGTTGTTLTVDILQMLDTFTAGAVTVIMGASGNNNVVNLNLGGDGLGMGTFTGTGGTGVDTLSITSGGTSANAIATGSTLGTSAFPLPPSTVYVTGAQNLTMGTFTSDVIDASGAAIGAPATATGNMTVTGSATANVISGGDGNDNINGGAGADILSGGGGDDTLTGAAGIETLTGGTGSDTFNYPAAADAALNAGETITDFETGASADIFAVNATSFGINAGTADEIIDGWESVAGAAHDKDAEITVITTVVIGALTSANAATAIGNATAAFAAADVKLFVVTNGTDSAVFLFTESVAADVQVTAAELGAGPVVTLTGVNTTELGAMVAANFAFGAS